MRQLFRGIISIAMRQSGRTQSTIANNRKVEKRRERTFAAIKPYIAKADKSRSKSALRNARLVYFGYLEGNKRNEVLDSFEEINLMDFAARKLFQPQPLLCVCVYVYQYIRSFRQRTFAAPNTLISALCITWKLSRRA